jgi:hypothetical protein
MCTSRSFALTFALTNTVISFGLLINSLSSHFRNTKAMHGTVVSLIAGPLSKNARGSDDLWSPVPEIRFSISDDPFACT